MSKRVLVLGGSGMLGHRLVRELSGSALDVHATVRSPLGEPWRSPGVSYHSGIDVVARLTSLREILGQIAPDIVINCIGAIKQRDISSQVEATFFLNGTLPHLIALSNPNRSGRVFHVSTDCVYRGDRGQYGESEMPDAEDLYGRSKAVGEVTYGRHLTVRTSIIGFELAGHLGLLSWFFRQPRGATLRGFQRAVFSGLPAAAISRELATLAQADNPPTGIWHIASEPINKYDLLSRVNETFDLGHTLVPDDGYSIDRSLNDDRYRRATGTARPKWDSLIEQLRADWDLLPYAGVYDALRASSATLPPR